MYIYIYTLIYFVLSWRDMDRIKLNIFVYLDPPQGGDG